jgi:cobalt-precorrin 5A hydrolase
MIVAGFGFRNDATVDSLRDALARFDVVPDKLATVDAKADAAPLVELGWPIVPVCAQDLEASEVLTVSPTSLKQYGTGSVAEAAALAAAGPGARLLGARQISHDRMATCAIAIGETK